MLVLIDNFDSFTYNIAQAFQTLGVKTLVLRNNVSLASVESLNPEYLVIGPGPGSPSEAGISKQCINLALQANIPLLGICLGHQALAECFGSVVKRAKQAIHGKTSPILHTGKNLFQGIPQGFKAVRYHSLIVDQLSNDFSVTGWTENGEIMAVEHREKPLYGVQFHPESVGTEEGIKLLQNFLALRKF